MTEYYKKDVDRTLLREHLKLTPQQRLERLVVGGVAAGIHGALRTTLDLDVVYGRHPENVARLVAELEPFQPYLRGAPSGLPFRLDADTVLRGLNFTLTTTLGDLDLLGEVTGGGRYDALKAAREGIHPAGPK